MDVLRVFCISVLGLISCCMGLRIPLADTYESEYSNVHLSEEFVSSHLRHKRSPNYLPDRVNMTLQIKGGDVRIYLQRNHDIDVNIPIYTEVNGEFQTVEIEDIQGAGLYQDLDTGASLLLQRETHTEVFGSFSIDSRHYCVQPNDDVSDAESRATHVVSRMPDKTLLFERAIPSVAAHSENAQGQWSSPRRRHRRQSNLSYVIETLFVTDYKIYQFQQLLCSCAITDTVNPRYNGGVCFQTFCWYNEVAVMASLKYERNHMDSVKLEPTVSPWAVEISGGVDKNTILEEFLAWVKDQKANLTPNDHVIGFTGYDVGTMMGDVFESDSVSTAFIGSLCTYSSVSIVEDGLDFLAITRATHVLGHSLGAAHDGDDNQCSSYDNYIMAKKNDLYGRVGKNLWIFSECSLQDFQEFINELDRVENNCMLTESSGFTPPNVTDVPMAQVFGPDDTCVYANGNGSYVCRSAIMDYSSICVEMPCKEPESGHCSIVLPAEKTSCGNGKWCEMGVCVASPNAPNVTDSCPFGDRPGIVYDGKTCLEAVSERPAVCYDRMIEMDCCESCNAAVTDYPDCRYGNKNNTWCTESRWIEAGRVGCYMIEGLCCGTCLPLKNPAFVGCEFGDKLVGCRKESCQYYETHIRADCCETCYDGPIPTTPRYTISTTPTRSTTPTPSTGTNLPTVPTFTSVATATVQPTEEDTSTGPTQTTPRSTTSTTPTTTLTTTPSTGPIQSTGFTPSTGPAFSIGPTLSAISTMRMTAKPTEEASTEKQQLPTVTPSK